MKKRRQQHKIMRNSLIIISFICFVACNNKKNRSKLQINDNSTIINPLLGVWVRADYLDSLEVNKSPFNSFKYLKGISSFSIAKDSLKFNQFQLELNYNNHEGVSSFIRKEKKDYYINLQNEKGIVNTKIFFLNKNEISFLFEDKKHVFIRVFEKYPGDKGLGYEIDYITNKILFSNLYFIDKQGVRIDLYSDGVVRNFQNYKTYSVPIDFEVDPDPMDFIVFNSVNESKGFHFKFNNEKLELYEYSIDDEKFQLNMVLKINNLSPDSSDIVH
jgi:hypothetical protein